MKVIIGVLLMAERKPFLEKSTVMPSLKKLLEEAKGKEITEEQLREQRISFAFGNAPNDLITKDSVRKASGTIKL